MALGMSLAWVVAEDATELAAIHATAFDRPWNEQAMREMLAGSGAFGLKTDGGLILCRVMAGEMEVLTLAVTPDRRRRGLARTLLAAAIEVARQSGAKAAFLEVADDNAPAAALYAGVGFRRAGLRRAYYNRGAKGRVDALVMRLDLEPLTS
jgi:ribosomal-protein-alanine N-acetyltransferase